MLTVDTVRLVGSAVLLYYVLLTTLGYGLVHGMRIGGWYALLSLTYVVIGASLPGTGGDGGFASIGFMRTISGLVATVLYVGAAFAMNLALAVHNGEPFVWMFAISTWPGLLVLVMYAITACLQPRQALDKKYDPLPRSFSTNDVKHGSAVPFVEDMRRYQQQNEMLLSSGAGAEDEDAEQDARHYGHARIDGNALEDVELPTSARLAESWGNPNSGAADAENV